VVGELLACLVDRLLLVGGALAAGLGADGLGLGQRNLQVTRHEVGHPILAPRGPRLGCGLQVCLVPHKGMGQRHAIVSTELPGELTHRVHRTSEVMEPGEFSPSRLGDFPTDKVYYSKPGISEIRFQPGDTPPYPHPPIWAWCGA
ncbi:MAG: hypothetical protein ACK55Z_30550, partial [bacterium]